MLKNLIVPLEVTLLQSFTSVCSMLIRKIGILNGQDSVHMNKDMFTILCLCRFFRTTYGSHSSEIFNGKQIKDACNAYERKIAFSSRVFQKNFGHATIPMIFAC